MAKKFLDSVGLEYTLQGLSTQITGKVNAAVSACKSYTDTKIASLIDNAPSGLDTINKLANKAMDLQQQIDDLADDMYSALDKKSDEGHGHDVATNYVDGFMSADDRIKLDGIAPQANKTIVDSVLDDTSTNPVQNKIVKAALDTKADNHNHTAYVNQNAFSNVNVGGTVLEADSATDTFSISSGANITLSANTENDSFTITALDEKVKTTQANTTKLFVTGCTAATTAALNYDSGVYLTTTAGHLTATQFNGVLNGNANTATTATTANKTAQSIAIKFNSGTTEGNNLFTFNGSSAKTINITPALVGSPSTSTFESAVAQATDSEVLAMLESILG